MAKVCLSASSAATSPCMQPDQPLAAPAILQLSSRVESQSPISVALKPPAQSKSFARFRNFREPWKDGGALGWSGCGLCGCGEYLLRNPGPCCLPAKLNEFKFLRGWPRSPFKGAACIPGFLGENLFNYKSAIICLRL